MVAVVGNAPTVSSICDSIGAESDSQSGLTATVGNTSFVIEGHGAAYPHLFNKHDLPRDQL
jgi:hypothetical protein